MKKRTAWVIVCTLIVGAVVWLMLAQLALMQPQASVSGAVVDLNTGLPIAGATVRLQATANVTTTAADGSFTLHNLPEQFVRLAAWKEGYLIEQGMWVLPPQTGVTITIRQHYTEDNPDYVWFSSNDLSHTMSCVHCMGAHPEWRGNAHANSATNPRFFSVYNGTHLTTTSVVSPGYKLAFPGTPGNCAACHAPAAVVAGVPTTATHTTTVTGSFSADMNTLAGVETEGSFCEFCHKIGEVHLDPATGLPYDDRPGVLSMRLYRSPPGWVLWFGPFDDVTRRVSYLELEKKSQFCAACHQASFHGTPIYESFGEWLASPYPAQGIECQTCHMAPTGVDYFVYPEQGGLTRDPALIASHLQPGAADEVLLQNTVSMTVSAGQVFDRLIVTVTITNTGAGHHVPTDHPGRHMILTVVASDGLGMGLAQEGGPTVPEWGGEQAGLPGTAFAKVLQDVETGEAPVISYWRPVTITHDNRIPALAVDTSVYTLTAPPAGGPLTVTAELRFRRLYHDLMSAKGWSTPDIVMEESQVGLTADPFWRYYLPMIAGPAE